MKQNNILFATTFCSGIIKILPGKDIRFFANDGKKIFGLSCLIALLFCTLAVEAYTQDSSILERHKPNIVLIVSDGHGRSDLGCYGSKWIKTPNLDRLAEIGIRFINAYSAEPSGGASQSVVLTGLYNHANGQYGSIYGQNNFAIFPEIKTLPALLKEAGYYTAFIGKLPVAPSSSFPFDTTSKNFVDSRNGYEMAECAANLVMQKNGKPFFLYFSPEDPMRSRTYCETVEKNSDCFGNREEGYRNILPTLYKIKKVEVPAFLPDIKECKAELAEYAQAVSRLDLGIGRLIQLLQKTNNWQNTLLIYISDCGIAFPGAKATMYNPGVQIPCIVKLPANELLVPIAQTPTDDSIQSVNKKKTLLEIRTSSAMINLTDITPTILDFANAFPQEYSFHGRSFRNILFNQNPQDWNETYISQTFSEITMYYPMRAIIDHKYKLIWNIAWQLPYPIATEIANSATWQAILIQKLGTLGDQKLNNFLSRPEFELYDIENDPSEINNLAKQDGYQQTSESLKLKLKNWLISTNDPWVSKWTTK